MNPDLKWISQTSAVYAIRRRTGAHWDVCREAVAVMKTKVRGKRDLVHETQVEAAISTLNAPPALPEVSAPIKGLSDKQRKAISRTPDKWPSVIGG